MLHQSPPCWTTDQFLLLGLEVSLVFELVQLRQAFHQCLDIDLQPRLPLSLLLRLLLSLLRRGELRRLLNRRGHGPWVTRGPAEDRLIDERRRVGSDLGRHVGSVDRHVVQSGRGRRLGQVRRLLLLREVRQRAVAPLMYPELVLPLSLLLHLLLLLRMLLLLLLLLDSGLLHPLRAL